MLPAERAQWTWHNTSSADTLLNELYEYFSSAGFACLAVRAVLRLATALFTCAFTFFLTECVEWKRIPSSSSLSQVIVFPTRALPIIVLVLILIPFVYASVTLYQSIARWHQISLIFSQVLQIKDADLTSLTWAHVVGRINGVPPPAALRGTDMSAMGINNRLLRVQNYMVAMYNRNLIDISLPVPFLPGWSSGTALTHTLEFNISFALQSVLNESGPTKRVRSPRHRDACVEDLQAKFRYMALFNLALSPFIMLYMAAHTFFTYFEEYHKNPSSLSSREYSLWAQWNFREFNEPPHEFQKRLNRSFEPAAKYVASFPSKNELWTIIARFVAFVSGSFAAVLVACTALDPDLSLTFQVTPGKSVLFYLTVFTVVLAVARSAIPIPENVHPAPEELLKEAIEHTHHMPASWSGKLNAPEIHTEFSHLYELRAVLMIQEFTSVILTPFVLWFSLPRSAPAIVDFLRDFTVTVEGIGNVCSFAQFNFARHGNTHFGAPAATHKRKKQQQSREGKMEKSFVTFTAAYPDWRPQDLAGSMFLDRISRLQQQQSKFTPALSGPSRSDFVNEPGFGGDSLLPEFYQRVNDEEPHKKPSSNVISSKVYESLPRDEGQIALLSDDEDIDEPPGLSSSGLSFARRVSFNQPELEAQEMARIDEGENEEEEEDEDEDEDPLLRELNTGTDNTRNFFNHRGSQ